MTLNILNTYLCNILPGMEAESCGLRRFFTSLYSLPSFLFLLGAASLPLSLYKSQNHFGLVQKVNKFQVLLSYIISAWLGG